MVGAIEKSRESREGTKVLIIDLTPWMERKHGEVNFHLTQYSLTMAASNDISFASEWVKSASTAWRLKDRTNLAPISKLVCIKVEATNICQVLGGDWDRLVVFVPLRVPF